MNNKYLLKNSVGQQFLKAVEDTDCCTRQCCGPMRSFEMQLLDNHEQEIMHLSRPLACVNCCCSCCLQVSKFLWLYFFFSLPSLTFLHRLTKVEAGYAAPISTQNWENIYVHCSIVLWNVTYRISPDFPFLKFLGRTKTDLLGCLSLGKGASLQLVALFWVASAVSYGWSWQLPQAVTSGWATTLLSL